MWYTSTMSQIIRFGHQIRPTGPLDAMIAEAQAAEAAGFDVVTVPDHIGAELSSPMLVLAAIARETSTIRLGTFVLNNEMRNPVQLAWEAATLDRVSGGRFELGIGAGHTPQEFAATGIALRDAATRKARLGEAVHLIRSLLAGESVSFAGAHYTVGEASIPAPLQDRLPILVGGNGRSLLGSAGTTADIVGLTGLKRTLPDGHRHTVDFSTDRLERQIGWVRDGADQAGRAMPELNMLVQRVTITDDREAAATEAFGNGQVEGLTPEGALATPYLAFGTHDEIADQIIEANQRWGIGYVVARAVEELAPVIERVRAG